MKNDYTSEELIQALNNHDGNKSEAARFLGMPRKTFTNRLNKITTRKAVKFEDQEPESTLTFQKKKKGRYVITCAQNNTSVHKMFLYNLQQYCTLNNAQLVVIPIRYKNVTAWIEDEDYEVWWPSELNAYYLSTDIKLNNNLVVLGSLKIQATASNPLSSINALAGDKSAVIGHPQIALEMIATPLSDLPRQLITTGTVSLKNYSESKAGQLAAFHHSFGACLVEIDGDKFFTRQLNATENGQFYDLSTRYNSDGSVDLNVPIEALVYGDVHQLFVDPDVVKATWDGPDSMTQILKPNHEILHDVLDFFTANHHHKNNFFLRFAKHITCYNNVKDELLTLAEFHNRYWNRPNTEYHYIPANHNDALGRWLNEVDPKYDLENASFYFEMQAEIFKHIENNANFYRGTNGIPNPLKLFMVKHIKNLDKTYFHSRKEKVLIAGIDVNQHGDAGTNGMKGSKDQFARSGYKTVIGHSHTPGIKWGCYQVGTSSKLILDYNGKGYSSWMHTHCIIYPNGKRTLVNMIKGQWRLID